MKRFFDSQTSIVSIFSIGCVSEEFNVLPTVDFSTTTIVDSLFGHAGLVNIFNAQTHSEQLTYLYQSTRLVHITIVSDRVFATYEAERCWHRIVASDS